MVTPMGREVAAAATLTVDHDAHLGRVCGDGFAVVSQAGLLTVLDSRLGTVRRLNLGGPIVDLSVADDRWAWVVGTELRVGDPRDGSVSAPLDGAAACRWALSGQALWVASGTGDQIRVESRTPDGRVARAVTVPDSFGDSMVRLKNHPHTNAVVLWIAAGQDGQQSWLIHDDGTALTASHLPADDCVPAMFGPDGDWLLAAGDHGIVMVSWPDRAELRALSWADIDPDAAKDGSDTPGDCLMSLPDGFVSWSTGNGRLRTIDLAAMSVVDEIALAGQPVRTVADVYPNLAGDDTPCGDFTYAVPHGNGTVMSVHGKSTLVLSVLRDWSPDRQDARR
jgi:hypothetical protein